MAQRHARPKRPAVLSRQLRLAGHRAEVPRHARQAVTRLHAAGDVGAAGPVGASSSGSAAGRRGRHGAADRPIPGPRTRRPAALGGWAGTARQETLVISIHQVLATLGYGDAIGHEVLGIQSALRRAGYESEIFVETADHRLEALTRDYRELIDVSHPDNLLLHHFSLGSRASRTAFALPDRMALIYHNITPPEYFVGVNRMLARQCFRGRRELQAYAERCDLALGDSEFNRQDLEALGFPRTAVLPVVPDFSHLDRTPNWLVARHFDDEWTNIVFVGRVIANKKIEDVIAWFHAYHTSVNPRSRLLIVGAQSGFERYLASLHQLTAT